MLCNTVVILFTCLFQPIAAANIMTKPVVSTSTNTATVTSTPLPYADDHKVLPVQGIMGNMTFPQQEAMLNPLLLQGMVPSLSDLQNMQGTSFGLTPGLLPQFNQVPLQQHNTLETNTAGMSQLSAQMNQLNIQLGATMQAPMGRGQMLNLSSFGILPGLLPLVQNLSSTGQGIERGSSNQ